MAEANADAIKVVANAINEQGGSDAVSLKVAEQYVTAFEKLAKTNNTIILPANMGDLGSMIAGGMSIYENVKNHQKK